MLLSESGEGTERRGELCLAGGQVIGGYYGHTSAGLYITYDGKQYYRTGDLVELNAAGDLVFAGRVDEQVKIAGHRIEPAEVAHAISRITGKPSFVLAVGEGLSRSLAGFSEGSFEEEDVLTKLVRQLPAYMIPARIIAVDQLPLGVSDKVDTRMLTMIYERAYAG
jgi:acyl-coenzyme A synthetase/AMP-(fatty) acid ligase